MVGVKSLLLVEHCFGHGKCIYEYSEIYCSNTTIIISPMHTLDPNC